MINRQIVGILAVVLLLLCITTSCKATPEKPIVIGKGDGKLDKIISEPSSRELKPYEAPRNLDYSLDVGKDFSVEIKANVIVPDIDAYPVVVCDQDIITQAEADNIMKVLLEGESLYMPSEELTKTQIDNSINYYRRKLELVDEEQIDSKLKKPLKGAAGDISTEEPSPEELKELYKERIKELLELYDTAPDTVDLKPVDMKFGYIGLNKEQIKEAKKEGRTHIIGITPPSPDRRQMLLEIRNATIYPSAQILFRPYEIDGLTYPSSSVRQITLEEATIKAEELVANMGLDFSIVDAYTHRTIEESGETHEHHAFKFKRNINGAPQSNAYTVTQASQTEFFGIYEGECINIGIDDYGIRYFFWDNPSKLTDVVNENVPMLEFDEIGQIFDRQIRVRNKWGAPDKDIITRRLVIDSVELSYMLVQKSSGDEAVYIYLPVWDFYGKLIAKYRDDYPSGEEGYYILDENNERVEMGNTEERIFGYNNSFLTINAIDGSVIDRNLGY